MRGKKGERVSLDTLYNKMGIFKQLERKIFKIKHFKFEKEIWFFFFRKSSLAEENGYNFGNFEDIQDFF